MDHAPLSLSISTEPNLRSQPDSNINSETFLHFPAKQTEKRITLRKKNNIVDFVPSSFKDQHKHKL